MTRPILPEPATRPLRRVTLSHPALLALCWQAAVMPVGTDLGYFAQPGVFGLAAALTLAAIVGKQACALGVLGKGVDRLTVGLGMPRNPWDLANLARSTGAIR